MSVDTRQGSHLGDWSWRYGSATVWRRKEYAREATEVRCRACRDRHAHGCHARGVAVGTGWGAVCGSAGRSRDPDAGSDPACSPDLDKVEVHINYDEVVDEFTYGQQSDWIDFTPGAARVTITADRAGFNYAIFDAVYPAPAGNDYYLVITSALVLAGTFDRSPVPDGSARVVVVQGSVALPAVNVTASGRMPRGRPSSATAARRKPRSCRPGPTTLK